MIHPQATLRQQKSEYGGFLWGDAVSGNPNTLLGYGTWVAFGTGRTLVGVDAGQTEFDTVEETGGEKTHTLLAAEIPGHTHTITDPGHFHSRATTSSATGAATTSVARGTTTNSGTIQVVDAKVTGITGTNANTGGGGAHNNLQPYIVVYMWKRTT